MGNKNFVTTRLGNYFLNYSPNLVTMTMDHLRRRDAHLALAVGA
jgi:hypothetical protein